MTTTFVPAVIGTAPVVAATAARSSLASRMEIALGGGIRVIVGADVDAAALARVIKVLAPR